MARTSRSTSSSPSSSLVLSTVASLAVMVLCVFAALRASFPFASAEGDGDCAMLALKLQTGACSASQGLLKAFDTQEKASAALSQPCDELSASAASFGPPPSAECCGDVAAFGSASCACDPATLKLAQMVIGVGADGVKALVKGATAACRDAGVAVSDACGGGVTC